MGLVYTPDYAAAGLTLLIAVLSFPSLQKLVKSRAHAIQRRQDERIYEDEDGAASEDSVARFSNKAQFITIFVINVSAIVLAGADAIFTAVQHEFAFSNSNVPLLGISLLVPAWVSLYGLTSESVTDEPRYSCFCNFWLRLENWHQSKDSTA